MREKNLIKVAHRNNGKGHKSDLFKTVTAWLSNGFEVYSNSTAISFGDESLSYNQLDNLSNKIANYLISQGVKKGDRVGISLERSVEMIASVIGILKSGAAYVPIDPNYPIDRQEIMREDARLSLLISHNKFSGRFEANTEGVVFWENIREEIDQCSNTSPSVEIDGEDVAYVIFTSGSTGRPKGIEMPHRALSNLIDWQLEREYFKKEARVLQYSSISFDVSFQEIATTLVSGGTLFLIEDEDRRDPRLLLNILNNLEIERLFIPFVALRSLTEVAISTNRLPGSLNEVITAGEQLRVDSNLRDFFSKINSILDNQYGPSETHVISAYLLDQDPSGWPDLPPIGKPLKNTGIYILDKNMNPLAEGEPGELYLAGRNLAHGYIGRKDLTKKSFIENSLDVSDYQILYKTGDLGFYNEDGDIEFLGRADHQIKIRGYRVEPGEINTVGAEYPGIAQCFTRAVDGGGHPQLVTYYVSQNEEEIDTEKFVAYLKESLPGYMVPAFIMELDDIPYTPSGKVDLNSLPEPERQIRTNEEGEEVTYQSETENQLAEIWREVLGFQNISRSINFFDLGGDSLKAVTLFMKIEEQFDKYLPLSTLTQAPSIKELAKVIDGNKKDVDFTQFRSLQLIQRGSVEKTPLFLVHGGAGNVLMFNDLAKGLPPDQPVYAFQWPGWDGYKGEDDIKEMAKFYKNELREARPAGPYKLGGHCIGGIIAIEIAQLLKAEGAEVRDPVLVSDAPNLHSQSYHSTEPGPSSTGFKQMVNELESKIGDNSGGEISGKENNQNKDYSIRRFPRLAKYMPFYLTLGRTYFSIKEEIQLLKISLYKKLSIKIPVKDRRRYCSLSQKAAIKKHSKSVYEGDILYLKSKVVRGRTMGLQGWWEDIFFGFEELCAGQFDARVIGGEHNDVLKNYRTHQIIKERMFGDE